MLKTVILGGVAIMALASENPMVALQSQRAAAYNDGDYAAWANYYAPNTVVVGIKYNDFVTHDGIHGMWTLFHSAGRMNVNDISATSKSILQVDNVIHEIGWLSTSTVPLGHPYYTRWEKQDDGQWRVATECIAIPSGTVAPPPTPPSTLLAEPKDRDTVLGDAMDTARTFSAEMDALLNSQDVAGAYQRTAPDFIGISQATMDITGIKMLKVPQFYGYSEAPKILQIFTSAGPGHIKSTPERALQQNDAMHVIGKMTGSSLGNSVPYYARWEKQGGAWLIQCSFTAFTGFAPTDLVSKAFFAMTSPTGWCIAALLLATLVAMPIAFMLRRRAPTVIAQEEAPYERLGL